MTELTWPQRGRLWLRLGIRLALTALALWAAVRLGPPLVSLLSPFLLAALTAWALSPAAGWLHRQLGWPRKLSALLLLLLSFGALFGLMWALTAGVVGEVTELAGDWQGVVASLEGTLAAINAALTRSSRLFELLPAWVHRAADGLMARLVAWLETAIPRLLSAAADGLAARVRALPSSAVATVVFVMAAYFLTADYPSLRARAVDGLPRGLRLLLSQVKRAASAGFGGYVKAQVILSVGVFFILLAGFLLIHQPYVILLAFLLAVLDFVPILGAGTVMVPWAAIDLLTGQPRHALGLLAVWGIVALFRRLAEPKVLGDQTGLSPILSLVSVYVGMRLAGVWGMLLAPVLCLVARNVALSGVADAALADLRLALADLSILLSPQGKGTLK